MCKICMNYATLCSTKYRMGVIGEHKGYVVVRLLSDASSIFFFLPEGTVRAERESHYKNG
jgi:hypothetical protein